MTIIARLTRWLFLPITDGDRYWSASGDELPSHLPVALGWTDDPATYHDCTLCGDTGFLDHAGFAMEPCRCDYAQANHRGAND